jgi:hypothetical protein
MANMPGFIEYFGWQLVFLGVHPATGYPATGYPAAGYLASIALYTSYVLAAIWAWV